MNNKNDKAGRLKVPWLSVLGNHDYGGAGGLADWSAQVEFTHIDPLNVWKMPFQYFKQRVQADGFFIDIFMNDINMGDCCDSGEHGICHQKLVGGGARKGDEGKCRKRMSSVSDANLKWLDDSLRDSKMDGARWQIVVGHFVEGGSDVDRTMELMVKHGAQLYVGGHLHRQIWAPEGLDANKKYKIPQIVTGAGGGIEKQGDGYGFFNIVVTHDTIEIQDYQVTSSNRQVKKKVYDPISHGDPDVTKIEAPPTAEPPTTSFFEAIV